MFQTLFWWLNEFWKRFSHSLANDKTVNLVDICYIWLKFADFKDFLRLTLRTFPGDSEFVLTSTALSCTSEFPYHEFKSFNTHQIVRSLSESVADMFVSDQLWYIWNSGLLLALLSLVETCLRLDFQLLSSIFHFFRGQCNLKFKIFWKIGDTRFSHTRF